MKMSMMRMIMITIVGVDIILMMATTLMIWIWRPVGTWILEPSFHSSQSWWGELVKNHKSKTKKSRLNLVNADEDDLKTKHRRCENKRQRPLSGKGGLDRQLIWTSERLDRIYKWGRLDTLWCCGCVIIIIIVIIIVAMLLIWKVFSSSFTIYDDHHRGSRQMW